VSMCLKTYTSHQTIDMNENRAIYVMKP